MIVKELRRKVVHILLGTALSILYLNGILTRGRFLALLGFVIFMFLIYLFWEIPGLQQFMLLVEREEDMKKFPGIGAIYFALGFTLAAWLFPRDVALAAMLILTWADGVSVVVTQPYIQSYEHKGSSSAIACEIMDKISPS